MKAKLYSTKGEELKTVDIDDAVFGLPVNEDIIWYAINNELANRRLGTAHTKDRSEVHGSNAKPYKQKGTGRARRGDKKSPILVGGGVVFGPRHRDFSYSMPRKAKRLAIKTILSLKAQSELLKLVEDFSIDSGKTKEAAVILKNLGVKERAVLVLGDNIEVNSKLRRASANIPYLTLLDFSSLRAHDLFYARHLLMQESAAKKLQEFYKVEAS
jgi:large subunit ribosomal protein L4